MIRPGKMIKQVLSSVLKKPATTRYPFKKSKMPENFRGKLKFDPKKCVGCKMCMRDCPSGAINIVKTGEKEFICEIDLGKCVYCGQCADSCLKKAIEITDEFELAQLDRKKLKVVFNVESKPEENNPGEA
ncbi:MAG: 4Fe-4S dicluster domain-containing protein [Candidatus Omnitrophica bacterium]|nr:4Fe-4S dicluster domain-containing protein [Candidatus Omnitrophota bacterium]